ncbi:MAG: tetraacyldisaccharide 4'-kinase [Nitrospiraceae bacterium]|nr:tetraacyldisaccharide 4'-kinase [Nitrospiraceae bacterium]
MKGLFELAYLLGYKFDRRRKSAKAGRLPEGAVISVGNLTTGGTGKTPLVIMLAGRLTEEGLRVAVLTRGYKGALPGPALITPGMSAADAGDEPLLMAEKLPGVPVIKGKDRYAAGLYALALDPPPAVFILDDGFQHWRLKRDIDILILTAGGGRQEGDPFYLDKLLPVGGLREPLSEIGRAGIVVAGMGPLAGMARQVPPDFERAVRRYNTHAPMFPAWYETKWLTECESGKKYPPSRLRGREVFAFAGIGRPDSFRQSLLEAGASIRGFWKFRDHHMFTAAEMDSIRKAARGLWIITTEKDIMRLEGGRAGLYALSVEMHAPEGFFAEVLKKTADRTGKTEGP